MISFEQPATVWWQIAIEQVGVVKLGQKFNDFFLAGCFFRVPGEASLPNPGNGLIALQPDDEVMGSGAETEEPVVEGVLKEIPGLSPEQLLANRHRVPQADPKVGYTMPGFTECATLCCHATLSQSVGLSMNWLLAEDQITTTSASGKNR